MSRTFAKTLDIVAEASIFWWAATGHTAYRRSREGGNPGAEGPMTVSTNHCGTSVDSHGLC